MRPLLDRVLIRLDPEIAETRGGIIIPERARGDSRQAGANRSHTGEVVAVGPGRPADDGALVPMECAIGDRVLVNRHYGVELVLEGVPHLMVRDHEVYAVVEDPS